MATKHSEPGPKPEQLDLFEAGKPKSQFIVEHTTYKYGDKQEDETPFDTQTMAFEFALQCLRFHGGRVWIGGEEYTRHKLETLIK